MTTDRAPRLDQGRIVFSEGLIVSAQRRETGVDRCRNLGLLKLRSCESGREGRDFIGAVPPAETTWIGLQTSNCDHTIAVRVAIHFPMEVAEATRKVLMVPPAYALDLGTCDGRDEDVWIIVVALRHSVRILVEREKLPAASKELGSDLGDPEFSVYGGWRLP
ncbi:hypothetical protein [Jiella marina]|uniref:hypothetical protein n=1 Tax=Jiella sp. LLJ827 TaxID=2917712 RepID=UPI002100F7D4|nr:hypothetical protein [Jiella sp. LLJ827]MCQ0988811.1 hypothetical protein [Jiella sp. LLJ827]